MYCEKCENYLESLNAENEKLQDRIDELEGLIADVDLEEETK